MVDKERSQYETFKKVLILGLIPVLLQQPKSKRDSSLEAIANETGNWSLLQEYYFLR